MSDTTIQEEMSRCQWKRDDLAFTRLTILDVVVSVIVLNVDIPTRRLEVMYPSGVQEWVYMELCWKEGK